MTAVQSQTRDARFFCLRDTPFLENRWYLGDLTVNGQAFNNWSLSIGGDDVPDGALNVVIKREGPLTDINFAGYARVLVVSDAFRSVCEAAGVDASFWSVSIADAPLDGGAFWIMRPEEELDCVDEVASDLQYFEENDPVRPDLAGQTRATFRLLLCAEKTRGNPMFRLAKSPLTIVATDEMRAAIEAAGLTGAHWGDANGGDFYAAA